jgi:hypothetical protein
MKGLDAAASLNKYIYFLVSKTGFLKRVPC